MQKQPESDEALNARLNYNMNIHSQSKLMATLQNCSIEKNLNQAGLNFKRMVNLQNFTNIRDTTFEKKNDIQH